MFHQFFAPVCSTLDSGTLDLVTGGYAKATLDRLFSRLGSNANPGLQAQCEQELRGLAQRLWSPDLANVNTLLRKQPQTSGSALAQLLLFLASCRASLNTELETTPGDTLYFNGFRITTAHRIAVRAAADHLLIELPSVSRAFVSSEGQWQSEREEPHGRIWVSKHDVLGLAGSYADPELLVQGDRHLPEGDLPEVLEYVSLALDLIASVSCDYRTWCARVLRQVHLVSADPRQTTSRSAPGRPGSIVISHPADVLQHAEALIHECSHQYYYMVSFMTAIKANSNDSRLYYSALVNQVRPIDRLLLAYHATINILWFLEQVQWSGNRYADAAARRVNHFKPICRQLLTTIAENSEALTAGANAFWQGSAEQVRTLVGVDIERAQASA